MMFTEMLLSRQTRTSDEFSQASTLLETASDAPLLEESCKEQSSSLRPDTTRSLQTNASHAKGLLIATRDIDFQDPRTPLLSPLLTPGTPYSPESNTVPTASPKGRTISWSSAYFLIISRVIGSGIFATPGVIAQSAGSIGLSLLLWLLGAIISACGLAVSLELGCMLPRSGGEIVYLEFIYQRPRFLASIIVAVQSLTLGFTASNCVVFGKYVLFALGVEVEDSRQRLCAAVLIIVVTFIHARFLHGGILLQNALAWIKIFVLACMALAGFFVLVLGKNEPLRKVHNHPSPFSWDHLWHGSVWSFPTLATTFFKVSYAYSGYDNINNVLDEVRDPVRTLRTAAPAAMLTIFTVYLLLNIAYFVVVPLDQIKQSGELVAALFFSRLLGHGPGTRILPILIALSAAGNVMVTTFAQARVNQQIARKGFLPFSRLLAASSSHGTPIGGLLVHLLPSLVVILLPQKGAVYSFILEVKGYPAQMSGLAIGLGLLWLRRQRPELRRPFRACRVAVLLPVVLSCALLAAPFVPQAGKVGGVQEGWGGTYAVVGLGSVGVAVVWWCVWIKILPWFGGYRWEEQKEQLDDGSEATLLVKVDRGPRRDSLMDDVDECAVDVEDGDMEQKLFLKPRP